MNLEGLEQFRKDQTEFTDMVEAVADIRLRTGSNRSLYVLAAVDAIHSKLDVKPTLRQLGSVMNTVIGYALWDVLVEGEDKETLARQLTFGGIHKALSESLTYLSERNYLLQATDTPGGMELSVLGGDRLVEALIIEDPQPRPKSTVFAF